MAKTAEKAYEAIRSRILEGSLPPAFHLREEEIAVLIGVSRTPVREALRRLAAEGYVEFYPNRGAFVATWTERSLAELIDVRAELAAMAGRLAAGRIRRDALDRLTALNARMAHLADERAEGYLTEVSRLNIAFHDIILESAGNQWLVPLMQQTAYLPPVQRAQHVFKAVDWKRGFERYAEIIQALVSGDGEWAAATLRSHFHASKHALLRQPATDVAAGDHGAVASGATRGR